MLAIKLYMIARGHWFSVYGLGMNVLKCIFYKREISNWNIIGLKWTMWVSYTTHSCWCDNEKYWDIYWDTCWHLPLQLPCADVKGCDSPLYSEKGKAENILDEKNVKVTKRLHAFRGFVSTYHV